MMVSRSFAGRPYAQGRIDQRAIRGSTRLVRGFRPGDFPQQLTHRLFRQGRYCCCMRPRRRSGWRGFPASGREWSNQCTRAAAEL